LTSATKQTAYSTSQEVECSVSLLFLANSYQTQSSLASEERELAEHHTDTVVDVTMSPDIL